MLKAEEIALHLLTKETIENLSETQVHILLQLKWIQPLVDSINKLPYKIVDTLGAKLKTMAQKYETTMKTIEDEIKETQTELAFMTDELVADEFDMKGLKAFKELLEGK